MHNALFLVAALQLVTFKPPSHRAVWVVGYDRSTSVVANAFDQYPELARTAILPLL